MAKIIKFQLPEKTVVSQTAAAHELVARADKLNSDAHELLAVADQLTDDEYEALPDHVYNLMEDLYSTEGGDSGATSKHIDTRVAKPKQIEVVNSAPVIEVEVTQNWGRSAAITPVSGSWFSRLKQEDRDALYGGLLLMGIASVVYFFFFM